MDVKLSDGIEALRRLLHEEADIRPGGHLVYVRPHESARARTFPRATAWGEMTGRRTRIPPDCPRPVKGRCECPPAGNWRIASGTVRADTLVTTSYFVGRWEDYFYRLDDDGWWRCTRPYARALQRLRKQLRSRHTVLMRLLSGETVEEAWHAIGSPKDPVAATEAIIRTVHRLAHEERTTERTRPPRKEKPLSWIEKSESQQNAEQQEARAS